MITGATGFVGGWTARAVHERGHDIRFLVRNPDKLARTAAFFGFDASDLVVGDITDAATVAKALDGCDAVVHAAAEVALHGTDAEGEEALVRRNTDGARNVIGRAVEAGIDPIVHVSSCAVLWTPTDAVLHEGLPVTGGAGAYGRAKTAIEEYVRALQDDGAPIAITYPAGVAGPAAAGHLGEAGDALYTLAAVGVLGRTAGLTLVDVRDLADLHARLLEPGRGARRVVAGGHRISGARLAEALSDASGKRVRYLPIPNTALIGLGALADRFPTHVPAKLGQLSETAAQYLLYPPNPDNSVAEALGVTFRPVTETIGDVFGSS
ncbi:NAD-dependent epimerase/dehydratase family protein [Gordonia araii]|nr:NAD-dependent epimerase/dehydratase family protein [Gordonia araii]